MTAVERHVPTIPRITSEKQVIYVEPSLQESFGKRKIGERDLMVMQTINDLEGIHLPQKRDIYFYHLWQEDRRTAFLNIKVLVGEVREDELDRVLVRVEGDNYVTEKYSQFHAEFLRQTQHERIPALRTLLKKGVNLEEAAEEAEMDLQLARNIYAQSSYELFIASVKKGSSPSEAIEISGIEPAVSQDLLMALLVGKRPNAEEVFDLKKHGLKNSEIAVKIHETIKYVDKLTRVLVFLELIPPNKSRVEEVNKQNEFMRKIMAFRSQGLGNYVISEKFGPPLTKVEDATRLLVWIGLIKPISKRDALLQRYRKGNINKLDKE